MVSTQKFVYPDVRRDETLVEEHFGIKVGDPYRWLEDPDSAETAEFVKKQQALTTPYLESCPAREKIKTKLTAMMDYAKYGCPYKRGNRYFYFMNTGLQNQSICYTQDSLEGAAEVFLDPNLMSDDGTVALTGLVFSKDGETAAYSFSVSGSDWNAIKIKNVATKEDYPDEELTNVKFSSVSWTHDNKGFFYGRYDESHVAEGRQTKTVENQRLYYHRVGTPQAADVKVAEFPDHPKWRIGHEVSDCGAYLIITPSQECRDNQLYFTPVPITDGVPHIAQLTPVVTKFEADYEYITNTGSVCIFRTNKGAPNYQLIAIDLTAPAEAEWRTLIPQHETDVLSCALCVNHNKLVIEYMHHVKSLLSYHELSTGAKVAEFPLDMGSVTGISGKKEQTELFYQFKSFLTPGIIYYCDLAKDLKPTIFREIKVANFDHTLYETKQVFYTSKDGVKVPMFIIHKKDLVLDGSAPCLQYGYGGFNISLQPEFSVTRISFMLQFNAVFAIPNLRGGGEYGEAWHNSGRLLNKQNTFSDFHAASEYLISEGYTNSHKLILLGGSNGGLTVMTTVNQRPDLYGAAISQVGVLDLLRFHKFTIGFAWCSDFGNPDEEKFFKHNLGISPLHNVKPRDSQQYPACLLLTADHDDRVSPLHSFKFISELQHQLSSSAHQLNPLLIRVESKAGHGGGKPTAKVIDEHVDMQCFIMNTLSLQYHE